MPPIAEHDAEVIYSLAYAQAQRGNYDTALDFLNILNLVSVPNARYLEALGITLKKLAAYEEARHCYVILNLLEQENLDFHLDRIEIELLMGLKEGVRESLENIIIASGIDSTESASIRARASALIDLIR